MIPELAKHLEKHLGIIASGWGGESPIKVVRFLDQPQPGVVTYVTMGLSRRVLSLGNDRDVRQELLVSVDARYSGDDVASLLMSFGEYVASHGRALLRGDVVGPSDPIMPGVAARALYASMPVYFDESFATFHGTAPPTVFVWLIPLLPIEANFVKSNGWDAFEDRLESEHVDFWNLNRPALTFPDGLTN